MTVFLLFQFYLSADFFQLSSQKQEKGYIYMFSVIVKYVSFSVGVKIEIKKVWVCLLSSLFKGLLLLFFSFNKAINLRSTRNIAIIGIGLLLGLMMPYWATTNPDKINTGK